MNSFVAADVPSVVQNLSVTIGSTNVVINWDPPASENGLPVTAYTAQILNYGL